MFFVHTAPEKSSTVNPAACRIVWVQPRIEGWEFLFFFWKSPFSVDDFVNGGPNCRSCVFFFLNSTLSLIRMWWTLSSRIFRFVLTLTRVADQRCLARVLCFSAEVSINQNYGDRKKNGPGVLVAPPPKQCSHTQVLMASLHLVRERCERRTKFPSRKLESRVLSVYTIYKFQIDARFHHDSASMFINRRFRVLF